MSNVKFCPECGAKILETQKFCAECGYNFEKFEKTVGVFPDTTKKDGEGTIGIFETKKEKLVIEKTKKENKQGTPIYKKWYVWTIAAVVIIIGLVTAFGGWDIVSDMAMYDMNDTSRKIKLNKEVPDSSTLSYYDFVTSNCLNEDDVIQERIEDITGHSPKWQRNGEDIQAPFVKYELGIIREIDKLTEEEFNNTIRILKDRLDILEVPYAIEYGRHTSFYDIYIKTGLERMGQPVTTLLTYRGAEENNWDGDEKTQIVSQMRDIEISNATDFSFKKKHTGQYEMCIELDKTRFSDEEIEGYKAFLKEHIGENLYWVLNEKLTVASIPITKDIIKDYKYSFEELSFLNNRKPEWAESFLLKLMYVALKGEQYPISLSVDSDLEFSNNEISVSDMGYQLFTPVDEGVQSIVKSICPTSEVYRSFYDPLSLNIDFKLEYNEDSEKVYLQYVKDLYNKSDEIRSGAYTEVDICGKVYENGSYMGSLPDFEIEKNGDGNGVTLDVNNYSVSDSMKILLEDDEFYLEMLKE